MPFKLDHCDKPFVTESKHSLHLKMHCGEKQFKCDHCGIDKHMMVHNEEKPFQCTQCDKAFS